MNIVFGILCLMGAVLWIGVSIKMYPPGAYKTGVNYGWKGIILSVGISLALAIVGIVLII
jgi:hypothetical protein